MTTLQTTVNALQAQYDAAQAEASKIYDKLWKARDELKAAQMKALSKERKKAYLTQLKRLKRYIVDWLGPDLTYGRGEVEVAFRKRKTPYQDDYHEDMDDPLDWMIAEYDLLAMSEHLEIRIDYFNEAVKEFVTVWFKTHMKDVRIVDEKSMFAFRSCDE